MRVTSLLVAFCLSWFFSTAQEALERKVMALFDVKIEPSGIAYYHGRFDNMQEVIIALAFNNKNCRGVLRYLRSEEELLLKGELKKENIRLEEINNFGKISGLLQGTMNAVSIDGWWSDPLEERYIALQADRIYEVPTKATHCGKGKWIRYFTQSDNDSKLIVQKSSDLALSGIIYMDELQKSFKLEGGITNEGYFELGIIDGEKILGQLISKFNPNSSQNIIVNWSDGRIEQRQFINKDKLFYGCMEYGDFLGYYAMTYPLTRHESYNKWIEQQVSSWATESKKYVQEVRRLNPELEPRFRTSIQSNAWADLSYFDGNLISGLLNYTNNWSTVNTTTPFIYDLNSGQLLNAQNLFENKDNVKTLIEEKKQTLLAENKSDLEFCEWVAEEKFELINIHFDGLSFDSNFHPVFGRASLLISNEEIKPLLATNSALQPYID